MTTVTTARVHRAGRRTVGLAVGLAALLLPLAACGGEEPAAGPEPSSVSIDPSGDPPSPSGTAPSSAAPTPTPSSAAPSADPLTAAGAVKAAESAVADSTAVEVSQDDDNAAGEWEVTVRAGNNGRELRIGSDGSVVSDRSDRLDDAQLGELPKVTATEAITAAEKRVDKGTVTDLELTRENGQRVWDVSVQVGSGDEDWELRIDASSGRVVSEERD